MKSFIVHQKANAKGQYETELLKPNKMSMKKALKKVVLKYPNQIILLEYWSKDWKSINGKRANTLLVDTNKRKAS